MADISKLKLPNGDEYNLKDVNGRKESYLTWGGQHFSASYGPIDAAMIGALGANRFAFLKAAGLTIEYSTNGGTNWADYGASDENKTGLFGKGYYNFYLGKHSTKGSSTLNDMFRVTIATGAAQLYTTLNKIAIYMSTAGNTVQVKMEKALENTPTNFITHLDWTGISGWSGWNILNISNLTTYGNSPASQYGRIRFIFKQTAINNGSYPAANIIRIMGFGGVGWTVPSNMAADGHLYSYDNAQNATFPAKVTATQFNGNVNGNATNVTGIVTIDHGGTGKNNANDAANALLSGLPDWTADPSDDVKLIRRDTGGAVTFGQIKFSTVWNYIKTKISSVLGLTATTYSGSAAKVNNHTVNSDVPANAKFTDTTYESKTAAQNGTDVSLVTTGEKYTWNSKTSNTGTVTKVTAGTGLSIGSTAGGNFTTSGTINHTNSVTAQNTQAIYPIKIDAQGHISAYGSAVTPLTASSTLDATKLNGTIPTACLPSYVDDVLQYAAKANFPSTGETGKIYVDKATNLTWRWGGSTYVEISPSLALGTTSSTAFRGDYGNAAYAHAVTNKGSAFSSGLYKITTNSEGHVTAATAVQKSDITGLGIPGTDNDTKNTAGSTNSSKKLFLIGAETQAANPQTYSQDTAYVGTDGKLYSNSKVVLTGGSNAASSVTITPSTTDVYSMTSAGSVTAGTKNVPTKIDTSKFSGGSFTRGTFNQGTLPTLTFAMDTTDTKKLKISFSQGTLPTHAADSFTAAAIQSGFYTAGTANVPTAITLPGRSSSAIKAWTGYTAATAAAQTFTGSSN